MRAESSTAKAATVLPFKREPVSLATQQVIELLEDELASLRSGKIKADAAVLILVEGEDTDIVYANLTQFEAIGTMHVVGTKLAVEM